MEELIIGIVSAVTTVIAPSIGYIISREKKFRQEVKELNSVHRDDIKELMKGSKKERDEQRASLESITAESNRIMTNLTITVAELKIMVDSKMR